MKILLVSVKSECSRGGIATWTSRYLKNCEAHDFFCDIVNTEMVGKRKTGESSRRNLFNEFFRTRRIFEDLKKHLKNTKYDVAHLNTSCGFFGLFRDYFVAKRIKRKKIRLITHFHCDIPYWISNKVSKYVLGKLVAISDENLVLCENSRLYLKKAFDVDSRKVPNFIDDTLIKSEGKYITTTLSTVVFVGRVSEAKGARELYLLAEHFPNLDFRLVGDIHKEVLSWHRPSNITFVGSVPHNVVIEEIDKADVFIFPSHTEGFSLALTEAMARGVPSIVTNVGANADMLDGDCGILVTVGDVFAMENALARFHSFDERYRTSQNAIEKVKKKYSEQVVFEAFKEIYQL